MAYMHYSIHAVARKKWRPDYIS